MIIKLYTPIAKQCTCYTANIRHAQYDPNDDNLWENGESRENQRDVGGKVMSDSGLLIVIILVGMQAGHSYSN